MVVFTFRQRLLLCVAAILILLADWYYPVSDSRTRLIGVILVPIIWIGFGLVFWIVRPLRYFYGALTVLIAVFLLLPARHPRDLQTLRNDFTAGLQRYLGVRYYWGGESPGGIDCSGLMRRGLIDALFLRGLRSADPGLIRSAVRIWWHDCTAADLGSGRDQTERLFSIPAINRLDVARLQPGDMAVTQSGNHVMAYAGGDTWIEADPELGRVIAATAPSSKFGWFFGPMNIVRWKILDAP